MFKLDINKTIDNTMYTVQIQTTGEELGEFISLVRTRRHTTLVSATQTDTPTAGNGNGRGKMAVGKDAKSSTNKRYGHERDPRLVYAVRPNGTYHINVRESLYKLGLKEEWLMSHPTRLGSPEHAVKMSITRSKSATERLKDNG